MVTNDLKTWRKLACRKVSAVAPILHACSYIEDDGAGIGTFCVNPDTLVITYSPKWAAANKPDENAFVLAHEGLHVLCDHLNRRLKAKSAYGSNFQPHIWMYAEEDAVNELCQSLGDWEVPCNGVKPDPKLAGLSTEEKYAELLKRAKKVSHDCHCIADGATGKGTNSAVEMVKQQAQEAGGKDALNKLMAKNNGQLPGNLPGELKRIAMTMRKLERPPDFKELLKRYLIAMDHNCRHFDPSTIYRRRQASDGLCIPNISSQPAARKFVVSIDNSGSVSDTMFASLKGVLHECAQQLGFQQIVVQHFTTQVMRTERYTDLRQLAQVARQADGGTALDDCDSKAAVEHPQFHLILTDGYVEWLSAYSVPTIIVRTCAESQPPNKVRNMVADVMAVVNEGD